jgi:hypothetical protein
MTGNAKTPAGTSAHRYGARIPLEEIESKPHPIVARMALELLWNELSATRMPSSLEPEEQAVNQALFAMHKMLWDKELDAIAETGLIYDYLVIRPGAPRGALQYRSYSEQRLEEIFSGSDGLLVTVRKPRTVACQKTGGRAQAHGAVHREIRVIWRKLDCLNPSLQKVEDDTCRKGA